jgi:purine-binding chemotaxis protein CheW
MSAEPSPTVLGLEELLPAALTERLQSLAPGIAWALDSLAVSFGSELEHLEPAAREAFARLTLNYGESLASFLRLAREGGDPGQQQERQRKMHLLRRLDLFSDLNDFDLGQIAVAFRSTHVRQGEVLAEQGTEGHAVFFVERGHVGIVVDGNQVAVRGEGTLFGETSVIIDEPVSATLRAVSDCELLVISREDFGRLVLGLPELVPKIARIGFSRLEEATHRLSEVLGHMPDALLKIDREGIIAGDISSKCFAYLGEEVLTGRKLSAVIFKDYPSLRETWDAVYPEAWAHPERCGDEDFALPRAVEFELGPQNVRHYELRLFPCARRGVQDGFDVAIADLTEQKRVEEERERMRRALQRRRRKFMLFRLAGQRLGVEIEKVREIVEVPRITRIPNAPAWLRGFFNLRGRILPALDLRVLLELPADENATRRAIFIVELKQAEGTVLLGLLTDGVDDILDIDEPDITPAAELALDARALEYLYGIARTQDGERLLLDPERLLNRELRRTLEALQPPAG